MNKEYSINRMDDQSALVTGGAGFIGSNLVHQLVALGAKVTVYDCLLDGYGGNLANLKEINDKIQFVKGDIRDIDLLKVHVREKDFIFNYASQVSHIDSMSNPFLDIDINCRGHMSLLEACRKYNDSVKIVYNATRGQVGESKYTPVDENHPDNPPDVYGINKLAAEKYHLLYHKVYGIKTTSIRMNNTYGPRHQMKHGKYGILNWFIRRAMLSEVIEVYGDGSQTRDYNYVDDANDAALLAAQSERSNGEVFLLGSGEEIKFIDMVQLVLKAVGSGEYKQIPWPSGREAIDVKNFYVSFEKINKTLHWYPKTDLRSGLKKTVDFYRERLSEYI